MFNEFIVDYTCHALVKLLHQAIDVSLPKLMYFKSINNIKLLCNYCVGMRFENIINISL